MPAHPLTVSTGNKVAAVTMTVLSLSVSWGVLVYYGQRTGEAALIDAGTSVIVLFAIGYGLWFMLSFMRVWQAQWLINILIQCLCHGSSYTALAFAQMEDPEFFIYSLPLRFLLGVQFVNMLMKYYLYYWEKSEWGTERDELKRRLRAQDIPAPSPAKAVTPVPRNETGDCRRISVKDGATIHIIKVDDIFCLQAGGDYVTIFTPTGQYLKEQTLKYFEIHLPAYFVRIHRSTIVNTNYIFRVELFGKDNYVVKLKNGMTLKASTTGHRLLRERLAL
ncbi:MAG: LytTR family transcriptional regulator DNA-binding domain-containing protein [Tannerellaceae bacterium]|jgi:hypothetical protein|nr:LytTR family transcriptional regulator DNA-binding domain-containing protein [Tannerellaceae bacterium]